MERQRAVTLQTPTEGLLDSRKEESEPLPAAPSPSFFYPLIPSP